MAQKANRIVSADRPPLFSLADEGRYETRRMLSEKIASHEASIKNLKTERDELDVRLASAFARSGVWRLRTGLSVLREVVMVADKICTPDMVGTVIRKGYSFVKYKHLSG
jgi:hypothetical protein